MGIERIKKNLNLDEADVIAWCKEKVEHKDYVIRDEDILLN